MYRAAGDAGMLKTMRRPHTDSMLQARLRVRPPRRATELSGRQRVVFACMALFQFTLLVAAQADLFRRAASEVRGPKWAWRIVAFINFIGPLSYFAFGRTSAESDGAD
ncbi:MAG: PLD nuclease N-terminal domain-containing protein [Dehalococcoidia bacterium]